MIQTWDILIEKGLNASSKKCRFTSACAVSKLTCVKYILFAIGHFSACKIIEWMVFYAAFLSFMSTWAISLKYLAQGHFHKNNPCNPVGLEPGTPKLWALHFTTEPRSTPQHIKGPGYHVIQSVATRHGDLLTGYLSVHMSDSWPGGC